MVKGMLEPLKKNSNGKNSHMDDLAYDGKITSKRNIPSREYRYRLAWENGGSISMCVWVLHCCIL